MLLQHAFVVVRRRTEVSDVSQPRIGYNNPNALKTTFNTLPYSAAELASVTAINSLIPQKLNYSLKDRHT